MSQVYLTKQLHQTGLRTAILRYVYVGNELK